MALRAARLRAPCAECFPTDTTRASPAVYCRRRCRFRFRARCIFERLLASPEARAVMQRDLAEVCRRLGPPGAIDRAADIIAAMLRP